MKEHEIDALLERWTAEGLVRSGKRINYMLVSGEGLVPVTEKGVRIKPVVRPGPATSA